MQASLGVPPRQQFILEMLLEGGNVALEELTSVMTHVIELADAKIVHEDGTPVDRVAKGRAADRADDVLQHLRQLSPDHSYFRNISMWPREDLVSLSCIHLGHPRPFPFLLPPIPLFSLLDAQSDDSSPHAGKGGELPGGTRGGRDGRGEIRASDRDPAAVDSPEPDGAGRGGQGAERVPWPEDSERGGITHWGAGDRFDGGTPQAHAEGGLR